MAAGRHLPPRLRLLAAVDEGGVSGRTVRAPRAHGSLPGFQPAGLLHADADAHARSARWRAAAAGRRRPRRSWDRVSAGRWPCWPPNASDPRVGHLVLLAPAVMFAKPGHHLLPPERLDEWRGVGALPFFHYADRVERPLELAFYEDSAPVQPVRRRRSRSPRMIFQGVRDRAVDPRTVEDVRRAPPERVTSRCSKTIIADCQPAAHLGRMSSISGAGVSRAAVAPASWRVLLLARFVCRPARFGRQHRSSCGSASPGPVRRLHDNGRIPLETYVARVLAGEAARDSPPAALEALAITIRTYALANRDRHRADGFDLCDETHCQVIRAATPLTERAARSDGRPGAACATAVVASVYYSASCGGQTEIPSNVWPGADDPPYLPSRRR